MKIFPRSHFFVRLIPAVVVGALMFGWPVRADELRRVALDGVTPVPAPVEKICNDGTIAIHQVSQPALELFPTRQQPARGTILVCPGGGYGLLAISKEGRDVAKKLNDFGYDAAVLLYHVNAGKATRELAMNDAQTAFRLLQQRGAKLGLNSQRIGVMGFSAVKTPAFVYVANDDPYALSAKAYAAACQAAHVPCAYYLKPHGGHGFGLAPNRADDEKDWPEKIKLFLDEQN
jgi:acetyl esterase/lipase